jgi:hypothetical protein
MDFESYFMSVSNVTCLFTSYILSVLRHVLGGMKNLKCYLFLLSILYMELYYYWIQRRSNIRKYVFLYIGEEAKMG